MSVVATGLQLAHNVWLDKTPSIMKGSMKSHAPPYMVELFIACYTDVARALDIPEREFERDLKTIRARLVHEGAGLLTKTLPNWRKAIDTALATGTEFNRSPLTGFSRRLVVIDSLVDSLFDSSGRERSDASPIALGQLRQLFDLFYKLELPYTANEEDKVISSFIQTEAEMAALSGVPLGSLRPIDSDRNHDWVVSNRLRIIHYAKALISRVLAGVDPLDSSLVIPRHGPGAVATGEKNWEKPIFKRFYPSLHACFPYEDYMFYNYTHLCDSLQEYEALSVESAGTARVVLVPKDSRGPRLISCEPLEIQYIQQGLMSLMVRTIERHKYTRGFVNFTDQTVNRQIALQSSESGLMATLDMKDASDRIHCDHLELFPPRWRKALMAARSEFTQLPDGSVLPLCKFAPMGSATCFPVEALVHWALAKSSLTLNEYETIYSLSSGPLAAALPGHENLPRFSLRIPNCGEVGRLQDVYVYGDDICVPTESYQLAKATYEVFGLKLNPQKCCYAGSFRESCGMDAYKGVDVSPVRIRRPWTRSLPGTSLLSWCAYHNALLTRGYFSAAAVIEREIVAIDRGIPRVPLDFEGGYAALMDRECLRPTMSPTGRRRYRRRFNRWEGLCWVAHVPKACVQHSGWAELLRVAVNKVEYRKASASRSDHSSPNLASWGKDASVQFLRDANVGEGVRAYQYALARGVTRKRAWVPLDGGTA